MDDAGVVRGADAVEQPAAELERLRERREALRSLGVTPERMGAILAEAMTLCEKAA